MSNLPLGITTLGACHLVASEFFDKWVFAAAFKVNILPFPWSSTTYLHLRIMASDIASSMVCLTAILLSFLASSQLIGTWLSVLQSLQLIFLQPGFRQRNSLSSSTGGYTALYSQKGHSVRPSSPAARISSSCCNRSS